MVESMKLCALLPLTSTRPTPPPLRSNMKVVPPAGRSPVHQHTTLIWPPSEVRSHTSCSVVGVCTSGAVAAVVVAGSGAFVVVGSDAFVVVGVGSGWGAFVVVGSDVFVVVGVGAFVVVGVGSVAVVVIGSGAFVVVVLVVVGGAGAVVVVGSGAFVVVVGSETLVVTDVGVVVTTGGATVVVGSLRKDGMNEPPLMALAAEAEPATMPTTTPAVRTTLVIRDVVRTVRCMVGDVSRE